MILKHFLFSILLQLCASNAAVFLWSNKKLEISPLQPFTMKEFSKLIDTMENPEVHFFNSPSPISSNLKNILSDYYSSYSPNGDIIVENATDLQGNYEMDLLKIKDVLDQSNKSNDFISVIIIPDQILKRQARETSNNSSFLTIPKEQSDSQSVIYRGQNKNNLLYALLYSSKSLLFKTNNTSLHLGKTDADMVIYDTRLNVNVIPAEGGGKISLRFSFSWLNGYWSLPSVKITDNENNRDYNLTTDENIMAPAYFSYHCNGQTVFSDENGVELYIYDLQVQMDSKNGKFGDANDCVSFTTAPIWSGLFVTTLLGLGLIFGLTAIMDIKTMDKFDNHKTKNLAITIME